jgi:hypothetical protein
LVSLCDLYFRRGHFGLHAGLVGTGTQLRVDEGVNAALDNLPAFDGGARRLRGLLRGQNSEKCVRGCNRNFVARPVESCLRFRPRSGRSGDIRRPQSEIERLPAYQDACTAVPHRAQVVRRHAIQTGDHALR